MKAREIKHIEKIALERGGSVKKKRIKKAKDNAKRLYDNRQKWICDNLPTGRTILVKDNEVLRSLLLLGGNNDFR